MNVLTLGSTASNISLKAEELCHFLLLSESRSKLGVAPHAALEVLYAKGHASLSKLPEAIPLLSFHVNLVHTTWTHRQKGCSHQ